MPKDAFREFRFITRDGLKLYARHYPAARSVAGRRPVVCLAGLTRNGRDFNVFAQELSTNGAAPRDVYTLDYRGRGHSDWDPDWKNYTVPVEALDVTEFMTAAGLSDAAIVGTSRGGLIAMALAAIRPRLIGAVVLNDIGPVIERKGLTRIAAYVGRMPVPRTWPDAGKLVGDMCRKAFPNVPEHEWEAVARQWFNERNGKPQQGYDPKLANSFSVLDKPLPPVWPQFEALKRVPVLVLRGETSDILSQDTVDEMKRQHPACFSHIVPAQGHPPLLRDDASITVIRNFLDEARSDSLNQTAASA